MAWQRIASFLLAFLAAASIFNCEGTIVDKKRDSKMFSIFSLVSFPNSECTVQSDTTMKGVCMSAEECGAQSGTTDGNCASGFGVCCMFSLTACDGTIDKNLTYIQNPGYSAYYTTASTTCTYTFSPAPDGICQIRLDFDTGVFVQPDSSTGVCSDSVLPASTTSFTFPTFCGTMTGQHIYIEAASQKPAGTLTITTDTTTGNRKWKIKVSQIECESNYKAPNDCLQYHTGLSNIFTSFNYGVGTMLSRVRYEICIRQEEGFCSIAYSTDVVNSQDAFLLDTGGAKRSTNCNDARLEIRSDVPHGDIYCGGYFNAVSSPTSPVPTDGVVYSKNKPFGVFVSSPTQTQMSATGFRLNYMQLPCGERLHV